MNEIIQTEVLEILDLPDKVTKSGLKNLKQYTNARIALGRTGASLPTQEYMEFKLAHAQAKDAVWQPFCSEIIAGQLQEMGLNTLIVESTISSKQEYLTRPDLGRKLSSQSIDNLRSVSYPDDDVLIVVADGLSSIAIHKHAAPFIRCFLPYLEKIEKKAFPVVIAKNARVALGDEIGELFGAKIVVMLIGERPGLSSPDSMGIYTTWQPKIGKLDSERNCISNVRPEGLDYEKAAFKLAWLVNQAFEISCTGIRLKDMSDETKKIPSIL
jgi:ethanolamine ammonia-lyase small subunit